MLLLISFPLLNRLAVENSFSSEYQKSESNMAINNDWQIENLENSSSGHFTSCDINSDGKDEFLFSLVSNEIIALFHDVTGHILWRKRLGAIPDTPVLADIDGDGLAEIIVCTSDGYINVLK
ncbi:MAG: FG-GAP repeat domain-containing protein [bacterium]